MPELIALYRMAYGRDVIAAGERFTVSEADARTLVLTGRATRDAGNAVPAGAVQAAAVLESAAAEAASDASASSADEPPKRKRGRPRKNEYQTRDLHAPK